MPEAQPAGRKKILVVEDDREMLELETFLLRAEGYQVIGAADGEAAVPLVRRERPDLVLLDLILPGMDGNEVLAELDKDPGADVSPVIVVSAYSANLRRPALTARVRRVITKPFDITDLLDAVDEELQRPAP
jgi:CheY-like chemotaxis protein